jgi:hypothetical protein
MIISETIHDNYMNLSNEEIMERSKKCGKLRFDFDACHDDPDCMFIEHYVDKFQESMPFCFSFDELMRYYIRDDKVFLKSRKIKSHKFINRDNICDVFSRLEAPFGFLNVDGRVLNCRIRID